MNLTLLIPDKPDVERDAVADAWVMAGGVVNRLGRFWDPPPYIPSTVRLYGNDAFCLVLAQKLGVTMISPADELLLQIPQHFLKRALGLQTLAEAENLPFPYFVKPLVPKQFRAAVYLSHNELIAECRGLGLGTPIQVAQPVNFLAEARGFILDGQLLDIALYEGDASLGDARSFMAELLAEVVLPITCVLDLGLIEGRGWALIEANASWGAGLNGCDAHKVIPALVAACFA